MSGRGLGGDRTSCRTARRLCLPLPGGNRYRGTLNPALQGTYFYADFCSGRIWKGIQSGGSWNAVEALDTTHNVSSFGEDPSGELYVVTLGGTVFRLLQAPATKPTASCSNRPYVTFQTTRVGAGTLRVLVGANDNDPSPATRSAAWRSPASPTRA